MIDYSKMKDEELREAHNIRSTWEGISTSVVFGVGITTLVGIVFGILGNSINWDDSRTWWLFGVGLFILIVAGIVSIVNVIHLRRIGEVQSARGRMQFSAIRRGRSYNPHEEITL